MIIIQENQIKDFLEVLKKDFEVFDLRAAFGHSMSLDIECPSNIKSYFFPPVEEIFTERKEKISASKAPKKFVLFGLNFIQLEALSQLDEIMMKGEKDFFYFQKREQSFIIGLIDEEIDAMPGGDIIFQKIGTEKYKVWAENEKAKKFIKKYKEFFEKAEDVIKDSPLGSLQGESLAGGENWSKSMRKLLLDPELLANAVEWSHEQKIWDELAEKCLGCGICTYVCPICHCFSLEDTVKLDDSNVRCRKWTSCVLPEFSSIAGGHSFRASLRERYYNWFYHKFVRAYREYGKSQCVGCGACKRNCPAGIDIQEVLKKILEDYKKEIL